jgi:hypothetical protein
LYLINLTINRATAGAFIKTKQEIRNIALFIYPEFNIIILIFQELINPSNEGY